MRHALETDHLAALVLPLRRLETRLTWLHSGFQLLVGSATIVLGVLVVYQSHAVLIASTRVRVRTG